MRLVVVAALLAGLANASARAEPDTTAGVVVVSDEPLPTDLWVPGTGDARRVTYWTRDSNGQPASTGAILVPRPSPGRRVARSVVGARHDRPG